MAMQHEEQKGLVFFLRPFSPPALYRTPYKLSKKHKSFVGFQVGVLVGAWRYNTMSKKDLAFFMDGFLDLGFFF